MYWIALFIVVLLIALVIIFNIRAYYDPNAYIPKWMWFGIVKQSCMRSVVPCIDDISIPSNWCKTPLVNAGL